MGVREAGPTALRDHVSAVAGDGGTDRGRRGDLRPRVLVHPLPLICSPLGGARGPHRLAPVFKSATVILRGNAYPCPERQHHVCYPLSMATLARACLSCGARKGVGVRGNLTVMGPRMTGAQSAPCLALNGPCGAPRGGLVQQAWPKGCTSRSRAGSVGRRVRRFRWLQRRYGGAPGRGSIPPRMLSSLFRIPVPYAFSFFCGSTGALHSISCALLTTHRGLGG